MDILLWIVFGGIVGWIASLIMKTDSQQGIVLNVVVGIAGAVLGGWLMAFLGEGGVTGFNFYSLMVAVVGAVVLLAVLRVLRLA